MINVLVAFENMNTSQKISGLVSNFGFNVIGTYTNGADLIRKASMLDGGIVICGFKFKDMTASSLYDYLPEGFSLLVVLAPHQTWSNSDTDILTLATPISKNDLESSLNILVSKVRDNKAKYKIYTSEEDKEIIEKAKAFLINKYNMTEEQAHGFIQKQSMDNRVKRVQTARSILEE